jgi:chondroitin AC lyase
MKHLLNLKFWIIFLILIPLTGVASSDIKTIYGRIVNEIMKGQVDDAEVEQLVTSLKADGTWPGINYSDISSEGFQQRVMNIILRCG